MEDNRFPEVAHPELLEQAGGDPLLYARLVGQKQAEIDMFEHPSDATRHLHEVMTTEVEARRRELGLDPPLE